jgi:hypothetical protein
MRAFDFRLMSEAPPKLIHREIRVLRQIRSGFCYAVSPDVREKQIDGADFSDL